VSDRTLSASTHRTRTNICRANLEFNITEDERIVSQLGNKTTLLEETLNSHRFAISLNPTNTDILFNAGQVLTSLAETLLESRTQETAKVPARALLEEAVAFLTRCLQSQEQEYEQMQTEIAEAQASGEYRAAWEGGVSLDNSQAEEGEEAASPSTEAPGDWATVEEPLTPESILETCTAKLSALTTLLGLYDPSDVPNIDKTAHDGFDMATVKIGSLISFIEMSASPKPVVEPAAGPTLSIGASATEEATTTPVEDAFLATWNFQASVYEVAYRRGNNTSTEYAKAVDKLFSDAEIADGSELATANTRSSYADALIDLASALADGSQYTTSSPTFSTDVEIQWTALTQAQTLLTQLAAAPYTSILSASRLADVYLARGDVDLFRFRISLFEGAKPLWIKSGKTIVANAGVFYRGARTYAEKAGAAGVRTTADAKAVVAEILKEVSSGSQVTKESWKGRTADVAKVVEQMAEEGIIGSENVEGVLKCVA
jgi:hypothetical protein